MVDLGMTGKAVGQTGRCRPIVMIER